MEGELGKRQITHYNYNSWPDFGNPHPAEFIDMVRKVSPTTERKPIVVHCSAGLGRSGVFATVHTALECQKNKRKVDIEQIVLNLRKQREGMVQTQDQYRFCYESTAEALASEKRSRAKSEPSRTAEPKGKRPLSMPPKDQVSSQRKQREPSIPPPFPGLPPYTEEEQRTTPSIFKTPPPPSSSPPPPISQPETPIKAPITITPEVIVSAPSTECLVESDTDLIQRKLDDMATERGEDSDKTVQKPTGQRSQRTPSRSSVGTRRGSGHSGRSRDLNKETKPAKDSEGKRKSTKPPPKTVEEEQPPPPPISAPPEIDDSPPTPPTSPPPELENEKQFDGFEVPEFPPAEEPEVVGFSIGDDQFIEQKPYKKSDTAKAKPKPANQPEWKYKKKTAPTGPKMERKHTFKPRSPPPDVVNKEPERKEARRVGKLAIPTAFGGSGDSHKEEEPPSPKLPVKQDEPVKQTKLTVHQEKKQSPSPSPTHIPSPSPKPEGSPRRVGRIDTSKFESPKHQLTSSGPSPSKPSSESNKPSSPPVTTNNSETSTGNTPPVLKRIKMLEAKRSPSSSGSTPFRLPIASKVISLSPTRKQPQQDQQPSAPPTDLSEKDSDSTPSVLKLLARFEKK